MSKQQVYQQQPQQYYTEAPAQYQQGDKPNFNPQQNQKNNNQHQNQHQNQQPQQQKKNDTIYQEVAWVDTIKGLRLILIQKYYDSTGNMWPRGRAVEAANIRGLYFVDGGYPMLYKETDDEFEYLIKQLQQYQTEIGNVYQLAHAYEEKEGKKAKPKDSVTVKYVMPKFYKVAMIAMLLITAASIFIVTRVRV